MFKSDALGLTRDDNSVGWLEIPGSSRVFIYRVQDSAHLYARVPGDDLSVLVNLPNERIVLGYALPPIQYAWGSASERVVYATYFLWKPEKARKYLATHYANVHVKSSRHLTFTGLGGYKAIDTDASWFDWVSVHWPDTADSWYSIGYELNPLYNELLNDFKKQYNLLNGEKEGSDVDMH